MPPTEPHISDGLLAALVDGDIAGEEERRALQHMSRCRSCLAAYTDVVRLVGEWRRESRPAVPVARPAETFSWTRSRRVLLAACLPLLVAAGAWLTLNRTGSPPPVAGTGPDRLGELLIAASHSGMILPGTGDAAWNPPVATRSGGGAPAEDLDPDAEPDPVRRISALLTLNQLNLAGFVLKSERDAVAGDPELMVLSGIYAYRDGRPRDAEQDLRRALAADPDDPVARFNLAWVFLQEGRTGEATELLKNLRAENGHPLVAERARRELEILRGGAVD